MFHPIRVDAWLDIGRQPPNSRTAEGGGGDNGTGFTSEPHFVIREHDLAILRPREIVFGTVASAEEAQQRMDAIINGPHPLSGELLMQLYIFREPDRTEVLHLMTLVAHCVSDRAANNTFVRCLLDTLARGGAFEPVQLPLEDRLAMATEFEPMHLRSLSPARRLAEGGRNRDIPIEDGKEAGGCHLFSPTAVVLTGMLMVHNHYCRAGILFRVAARAPHRTSPHDRASSPPHLPTRKQLP